MVLLNEFDGVFTQSMDGKKKNDDVNDILSEIP